MRESDTLERAYRLRAYPTRPQQRAIGRLIGAARFVWNWALWRRSDAYKADKSQLNWIALSRELTVLKRAAETAWLAQLPREPFNQVLRDQERAFANFFAQRARYPRFRRRGGKASVRFTLDQRRAQVARGTGKERWAYVQLPGLGRVKLRRTEALMGRLRSVTLSRDGAGRYFAAITADGVPLTEALAAKVAAVGVDAGLRVLATVHDGERARPFPAPKALAGRLARLRRYQRHQSRQLAAQMRAQGLDPTQPCPKGMRLGVSKRRHRTRRRIAREHARIADLRRDALHRVSTGIVREAKVIAIEALRVKAMARGMGRRAFRRGVADAALGELRRQITYKGAWAAREVVPIDPFYASSKTCSGCGAVNAALKLQKHWQCFACGAQHERDVNAAKNLRAEGLRVLGMRGSSPATGERPESNARGVACAADAAAPVTVLPLQRRPTANREPAQSAARRETRRAPSGTARRRVRAGL
ncbi:MAG: transposase [Proteobacteria bacterium]|nr:transposase [Pseudomonadota bacterium]